MAMGFWRDSARRTRFLGIDGQSAFPLLFFLLHIRWWTFIVALSATLFFTILERYGFSVVVFGRFIRGILGGRRKYARPWWEV
jgi:intracellular multiplication protein IcmT